MLNLQNIEEAKRNLQRCDLHTFNNSGNSFKEFLHQITIQSFRHINNFDCVFDHPVTVIAGANKIGKTSILLLIACSHENFIRCDSTAVDTVLRPHSWNDVLNFTSYENANRNYVYKLFWRVGNNYRQGEGKRTSTNRSWTGLGKRSSDKSRTNAKIRDREVRLIDLERIHPARNFSSSLMRKITNSARTEISEDIEQAFGYIMEINSPLRIYRIGSHVNKIAYLISLNNTAGDVYSSYNAASGEESLLNILVDIFNAPNDSLILIDEIEAGFHPIVQRRLADIIQYVSWQHKKQFVITTHSPSLMSAFYQKSRKYIDINSGGDYETISKISINTAFSKMDSKAYPLIQLYCEDELAKFIICKIMIKINVNHKYFDRLVNIITSGPIDQVRNDYERHKRNHKQMTLKTGYCCVFDGDFKNDPMYSIYHENEREFSFFLYPYTAPEKFLVKSYLDRNPNIQLSTALSYSDHHALFQEMVNIGLAADDKDARAICWEAFSQTPEYRKFENDFSIFLKRVVLHFSTASD